MLHPDYIPVCHPEESPSSFCSRIAEQAGHTARNFCLDVGLDFQGICDGRKDAIQEFLKLLGRAEAKMPWSKIRRTDDKKYKIGGECFTKNSLRRSTVRVCPLCLQEDLNRGTDQMSVRAFGRTIWMVGSIRTCTKHNVSLAVASKNDGPSLLQDFCACTRPFVEDIERHVSSAVARHPSELELYLENRMAGRAPKTWLSPLPAYAVGRFCEVIGATKLFGEDFIFSNLTEDEWYEAGQAGFAIAQSGAEGVQDHLKHMQNTFTRTKHCWGPRQIYGRLYEWLAHETDDQAYDRVREIISEYSFKSLPMGTEGEIFGKHPDKRIIHSVHSAHQETGAHPKRLKKVLNAVGIIKNDQLSQSDDRILFPANEAEFYLNRISESMSLNEARQYINAPRPLDRKFLEAGFLVPWLRGGSGAFRSHAFAKRDLDDFIAALMANSSPLAEGETPTVSIQKAAKKANSSVVEVVRLVVEQRLKTVLFDDRKRGFLSICVDPEEVKELVRGEEHGGYSLREVEGHLRTSTRVVTALIKLDFLQSQIATNPINRCPQTIVTRDELEAFRERFETASSLSRRTGIHLQTLMKRMESSGIEPAFPKDKIPATFYCLEQIRLQDPDLLSESK